MYHLLGYWNVCKSERWVIVLQGQEETFTVWCWIWGDHSIHPLHEFKKNPYGLLFSAVKLYLSQAYSYCGKEQKVASKVDLIIWWKNVRKETNDGSSKTSAHTLTLLWKALLFVIRNKLEKLCYFVIKDGLISWFLQNWHPWWLPCVSLSATHSSGSPCR